MITGIHRGAIISLSEDQKILNPGYLLFEDDRIKAVGTGEIPNEILSTIDHLIDASNMAVMPGIVNAHTHLFQSFIRGLGDDKPLFQWLEKYIWPVAAKMSVQEAKLSALLGLVENIRAGATSVIDNQYVHNTEGMDDAFCQAAEELGIRYLMARGWTDRNYRPEFIESAEEIIDRIGALIDRWNQHPSGRIRVEFGPLSQIVVSTKTMLQTYQKAKEWGVGTHMHTSETQKELEHCIKETGLAPVEWLNDIGCLDADMRLVHAVWLSNKEIELAADRGAKIVHCPVSNMYLASGVAPLSQMRKSGIAVALATDGPGSNNNQDMIETLKVTALLHKIHTLDTMVLLPEDILWMACRGGAEAFGQPDQIGSLEAGKKADIIIVDLNTPFAAPVHRPQSALVYNLHGSNVDTVIVDGKTLMRNKIIIILDEKELLGECRRAASCLMSRIS